MARWSSLRHARDPVYRSWCTTAFSFPHPPPRLTNPEARGLRHLAFVVPNLDRTRADLLAHGLALEEIRIDPTTGKRFCFFRDPDDLPLEIYEK